MTLRASGRIFPGFTLVGSGGGTDNEIITGITINPGLNTIAHTLGVTPLTVAMYDSTGQIMVLQWSFSTSNPTTEVAGSFVCFHVIQSITSPFTS